jgi:hypothetical protein
MRINLITFIPRIRLCSNYFLVRLVRRVPFVFVYNLYPAKRANGVMYFAAPNKKFPITDGTNPPFILRVLCILRKLRKLRKGLVCLAVLFPLIYSGIILSFQSK